VNRTTLSLIAGTAALAAVTALAALAAPDASGDRTATTAARLPVQRSSLLCPQPSTSDVAETVYTSFTPVTKATVGRGKAELVAAGEESADESGSRKRTGRPEKGDRAALRSEEPGKPVTGTAEAGESPALIGTADGKLAPGWTVQETTWVEAGTGRGLLGTNCTAPDTDFWLPGASTADDRIDYVHLTNPDDSAAVVDVELYGEDGALTSGVGEDITVQPRSSEPLLLSTLVDEREADLTVHVSVRSGRVGAAVQALDEKAGGDWLTPSADPAGSVVIPGIPKDATSVRLVAFAPGEEDAHLQVRLASPSGLITPAGNETLRVKAGMTAAVDLGDVTRGEAGSLVLTPEEKSVPVVAAVRVVRGKGDKRETAFIPGSRAVGARASVVDNRSKGVTLALTAQGRTAKVKVTASEGSQGGRSATETFTIKGGTTENVAVPVPSGLKGSYALTVEPVSGGPVYASRMLQTTSGGATGFTIQSLPDDRGTVAVPEAEQDLSVLQR
jgi:hypothetical protein